MRQTAPEQEEHSQTAGLPGSCPDECAELTAKFEGDADSQMEAFEVLRGMVWPFSQQKLGCRVVQLALGVLPQTLQKELVLELHGHVQHAIQSPHANFVIAHIVQVMPASLSSFVSEELIGIAAQIARHRFGCRVIIRLLEHSAKQAETVNLVHELLMEAAGLSRHTFGHFVIQAILEHGLPLHRQSIVAAMRGSNNDEKDHLMHIAINRHGCHVVEEAMAWCSPEDVQSMCGVLLADQTSVLQLAHNQFGCYVLRAIWRRLGKYAQGAWLCIHDASAELRDTKHGNKLLDFLGFTDDHASAFAHVPPYFIPSAVAANASAGHANCGDHLDEHPSYSSCL